MLYPGSGTRAGWCSLGKQSLCYIDSDLVLVRGVPVATGPGARILLRQAQRKDRISSKVSKPRLAGRMAFELHLLLFTGLFGTTGSRPPPLLERKFSSPSLLDSVASPSSASVKTTPVQQGEHANVCI